MVQLICLHCNRANTAEAKFCTECGASLLRKFCKSCHAANDSAAHFCQSCGVALRSASDAMSKTAPPSQMSDFVPSLTDVVTLGPVDGEQHTGDHSLTVGVPSDRAPLDPQWASNTQAPSRSKPRRAPLPTVVLLAVGAAIAIPIALWVWPAADKPVASALPRPAPLVVPAAPATMRSATTNDRSVDAAAAAAETAARLLQSYPEPASGADDKSDAGQPAAVKLPRDPRDQIKAAAKRGGTDAAAATPRTLTRSPGASEGVTGARPARLPPAAPNPAQPRECTPTLDALGLCAPATNSTRR